MLEKEAILEDVLSFHPDRVIVAIGANPVVIPIKGHDLPHVTTAIPALLHPETVKQNVVIIGGGEVGCEMGVEFASKGKKSNDCRNCRGYIDGSFFCCQQTEYTLYGRA